MNFRSLGNVKCDDRVVGNDQSSLSSQDREIFRCGLCKGVAGTLSYVTVIFASASPRFPNFIFLYGVFSFRFFLECGIIVRILGGHVGSCRCYV